MYKGKIIYNPAGKAGEYSKWAANFYNGCSGDCLYPCYMKEPPMNQCWSIAPTLKKCLKDETIAFDIFKKELVKNIDSLKKHGLFFNFNSDPFLKESFQLNYDCINWCILWGIPVKILTKQTWWIDKFKYLNSGINIGFTLTGHDELEPGCATNTERIAAMETLHERGFKTWASIEPIIDLDNSLIMIMQSLKFCDHYKIGLLSGKKDYDKRFLLMFTKTVSRLKNKTIYFKDSLLKQAGINREDLPANCVNRDYD